MSKSKPKDVKDIFAKVKIPSDNSEFTYLTPLQINKLTELKINDKEKKKDLFSLEDSESRYFLHDTIYLIKNYSFESIYDFLTQEETQDLLHDSFYDINKKRKALIMNNLQDEEKTLNFEFSMFSHPPKISEGVVACRRCGSKKTLSSTKQTRSGDEPITVTVVCQDCGARWQM